MIRKLGLRILAIELVAVLSSLVGGDAHCSGLMLSLKPRRSAQIRTKVSNEASGSRGLRPRLLTAPNQLRMRWVSIEGRRF
jgi:hypothetical protein